MKKLVSIILLVSLCASLCACSALFPAKRYLSPEIKAPETFLLTYEELYPDGSTSIISEGFDAEGNVYYNYEGVQYAYIKNPEYAATIKEFDEYKNEGGRWGQSRTEVMGEHGECSMAMIYMYAKYNLHDTNCTVKSKSTKTFLDRKCDAYTIVVHRSGMSSVTEKYTYEILIDRETGFCLKSICTAIDSPLDDTQTPYGFTCTEFTTTPASFADLVK